MSNTSRAAAVPTFPRLAFWATVVLGALIASAVSHQLAHAAPLRSFAPAIQRDPETGGWHLVPLEVSAGDTAVELALMRSSEGLFAEPLPGGGEIVNLQGRYQSFAVVSIGLDGRLVSDCIDDPLALLTWLGSPLPDSRRSAAPLR